RPDSPYLRTKPRTNPAPKVNATARTRLASALRGRISAIRASGANHGGYWGATLTIVGAGGAARALASVAAVLEDGWAAAIPARGLADPMLCGLGRIKF